MRSLALSGGGFRATLHHLGVLRCLAEEGKLKDIEAIYSVSGGSILAAHVVLNWNDYCDPQQFAKAARPLIAFMRRDVRGKVFRRWFCYRFGGFLVPFAVLAWAWELPVVRWWLTVVALLFTASIIWMCIGSDRDSRVRSLAKRYEQPWRRYGIFLLPVALVGAATPLPWVLWWITVIAVALFLLAIPIEVLWRGHSRVLLLVREYEPHWHRYGPWLLAVAVIVGALSFALLFWAVIVLALGLFVLAIRMELRWHQNSRVRLLVKQYEEGLYGTAPAKPPTELGALASTANGKRPKLFLLTTNMNTGDLCAFSDDGFHCWTGDGKKIYPPGDITVSEAVAASSVFPPAFIPFALDRKQNLGQGPESGLPPVTLLTDGGVYDNSGIEAFLRQWEECGRTAGWELIVSSAERAFDPLETGLGWYRLLVYRAVRANDIVMRRVGEYQIDALQKREFTVSSVRLADRLPSSSLRDDLQLPVRTIRTDLNVFSVAEVQLLVYHGYLGAKLGLFCPKVADLEPALAGELGYERGHQGVVVTHLPSNGRAGEAGFQRGMVIGNINGTPVNSAAEARERLRNVFTEGGTIETRQHGRVATLTVPPLSGFATTDHGMPYVAGSDEPKPWLPFPGDEAMKKIVPKDELKESHSVKMLSSIAKPVVVWLGLLLVLAGSAYAYVRLWPGPSSLAFASVFTPDTADPFEQAILKEIDLEDLPRKYKKSITPEDPASDKRLIYAITKPLGDYCQGRDPTEFQCRVTCSRQEYDLEVRLFLRSEAKNKRVYQMLSNPSAKEFSVPVSRASDRLVAIGRVTLPEKGELGDLNQLIRLEVAK